MAEPGLTDRLQFALVRLLLILCRLLPMWLLLALASVLASGAYWLMPRRRRLADDNVRQALGDEGARRIARRSVCSFALTSMPEVVKLRAPLLASDARQWMLERSPEAEALFTRVKQLHDASNGCVFVTPHLGNWELLPYIATAVGVPMVIPVRPLDNRLIEDLLSRNREQTGHVFLDRRNVMMKLQYHLRRGRSAAILADQSTLGGLVTPFFGRPALTTPVPAVLAMQHGCPIVVVACVRSGRL